MIIDIKNKLFIYILCDNNDIITNNNGIVTYFVKVCKKSNKNNSYSDYHNQDTFRIKLISTVLLLVLIAGDYRLS